VPSRRTRSGLTVALLLASAGEHTRGLIFAPALPSQHLNVSSDGRYHREVAVGRVTRLVAVVAIGIVARAGCQRDEQGPQAPAAAPSTQEISTGTLAAGEKVSAPKGEVVLTVSGEIGTYNKAGSSRSTAPGGFLLRPAEAVATSWPAACLLAHGSP
jgi:hypothetical protein